jgi:hypothetical protein
MGVRDKDKHRSYRGWIRLIKQRFYAERNYWRNYLQADKALTWLSANYSSEKDKKVSFIVPAEARKKSPQHA